MAQRKPDYFSKNARFYPASEIEVGDFVFSNIRCPTKILTLDGINAHLDCGIKIVLEGQVFAYKPNSTETLEETVGRHARDLIAPMLENLPFHLRNTVTIGTGKVTELRKAAADKIESQAEEIKNLESANLALAKQMSKMYAS